MRDSLTRSASVSKHNGSLPKHNGFLSNGSCSNGSSTHVQEAALLSPAPTSSETAPLSVRGKRKRITFEEAKRGTAGNEFQVHVLFTYMCMNMYIHNHFNDQGALNNKVIHA